VTVLLWAGGALSVSAQSQPPKPKPLWGRLSLFANTSATSSDASGDSTLSEVIGTVTFESRGSESDRVEYRADMRLSGFPADGSRPRRASVYDAWIGVRWKSGQVGLRAGQMWVNDLGGLGALAGGLFEVRQAQRPKRGRWRAALFAGLEPKIMQFGYAPDVAKAGALVAFDGVGLRRHVLGFVGIRDRGTTERSVLLATNLVPVGKRVFIYQAAEYDLAGPGAGTGTSRLTYFFTNARITPSSHVELQGTYHRGRSVDVRTLVRDQLDGRPIDPRMLDGLRFESLTGRLTLNLVQGVRLFGSYGRDTNNRDEQPSNRLTYGLFVSNLLGSGIDVNGSDSRMTRGSGGSYHSWYVSLGRSLGSRLYVTGDYGSSLSVFRFVTFTGFVIENRPKTRRAAFSGILNLPGGMSWLATAERISDGETSQIRVLSGVTYRF
jgi:hypothetical protein